MGELLRAAQLFLCGRATLKVRLWTSCFELLSDHFGERAVEELLGLLKAHFGERRGRAMLCAINGPL